MTTTDPEMQRLFDAACKMAEKHPAVMAYAEECRTKSSSPPPRVEPPEEFQIGDIVEANLPRFDINPAWHVARVTAIRGDGYGVEFFGHAGEVALKNRHIRRCESPCPPSRIEVSEEAIRIFVDGRWTGGSKHNFYEVVKAALAHFSPTQPAPVQQEMSEAQNAAAEEASRLESGFVPSLRSTLAYREITDEELNRIASENSEFMFGAASPIRFNWDGLHKFARTILSKYGQTLSNKTLDTLYDLAKTEEREQFKNDAKMVVGRKG